jgi:dipeptidyl-peptidase-4
MKRALVLLLLALPLSAQRKPLTFDAIYDPVKKVNFGGSIQKGFEWVDDSTFVWPRKDEKGRFVEWAQYDITTGTQRPLFDQVRMQEALVEAGVRPDEAKTASKSDELVFDRLRTAAVAEVSGDLWLWSLRSGKARRLTTADGSEEQAEFSPDGRRVAFVRANDLFVVESDGSHERRLTSDGGPRVLNGKLDWVYQEEVYGRGNFKGYWWSPDSQRIAFLRIDDTDVPDYTVVDHLPYHPELETFPYPKAGDPNPRAALKVVSAETGDPVTVDATRYAAGDTLIVSVAWRPDSKAVFVQVQDREQTWLDLVSASLDGTMRVLFRETTKAWVEPLGNPVWLDDGGFLWQSERSGFRHLYLCRDDGMVTRQLTSGTWEVRDLHGVDRKNGFVYFSATERDVKGLDVYRLRLDGAGLERLSSAAGTHAATFNASMTYYVDRWSDIRTPDQVRVHRSDGRVANVVVANEVAELEKFDLPKIEFLQVKTRDGFPMEALLVRPRNFDPKKRYPVYQFVYSGPRAQEVENRWRGQAMLFQQLIADAGAVVFVCDNRTASGKGAVSAWPAWKRAGEVELRDLEDAAAWLHAQPWIDGSRHLVSGWSYGGFMVTYALTHSRAFSAGIAGAPVTDWRDYDSIYTERLMGRPQTNADAYLDSAPRFAAKDLRGDLLLIHGTTDDNVHLQNTIQFAHELQQAGRQFEMMLYPRTTHSPREVHTVAHMQRLMFDFILRKLKLRSHEASKP